jgi:hypothetical protein
MCDYLAHWFLCYDSEFACVNHVFATLSGFYFRWVQ